MIQLKLNRKRVAALMSATAVLLLFVGCGTQEVPSKETDRSSINQEIRFEQGREAPVDPVDPNDTEDPRELMRARRQAAEQEKGSGVQ